MPPYRLYRSYLGRRRQVAEPTLRRRALGMNSRHNFPWQGAELALSHRGVLRTGSVNEARLLVLP